MNCTIFNTERVERLTYFNLNLYVVKSVIQYYSYLKPVVCIPKMKAKL